MFRVMLLITISTYDGVLTPILEKTTGLTFSHAHHVHFFYSGIFLDKHFTPPSTNIFMKNVLLFSFIFVFICYIRFGGNERLQCEIVVGLIKGTRVSDTELMVRERKIAVSEQE